MPISLWWNPCSTPGPPTTPSFPSNGWTLKSVTADNAKDILSDCDGILVPGGFGDRGIEGMIVTAQPARTTGTPYLGICLGMQIAVIEFARHVAGLTGAHSAECV